MRDDRLPCCRAVRGLLIQGHHNILSLKSLSNVGQPPANTELMLRVATQSWQCASSWVSGYNQDNREHNREQTLMNKTKKRLEKAWVGLKRLWKTKCIQALLKALKSTWGMYCSTETSVSRCWRRLHLLVSDSNLCAVCELRHWSGQLRHSEP